MADEELKPYRKLALLGDYNIATYTIRQRESVPCWCRIRNARFQALQALGLQDSFRLFEQPEKTYSWWDYRMLGFRRNQGLRIDHILLTAPLAQAQACTCSIVDREMRKLERPSDHAPVVAEIDLADVSFA